MTPHGYAVGTVLPEKEGRIALLDAPQRLITLTEDTFASLVLDGTGRIAVEFMSYGCSHCRAIEPVLQRVADMVLPNEQIFRVNVAVERNVASRYAIEGTPTLIFGIRPFQIVLDVGYTILADVRPLLGCESCGTSNPVVRFLARHRPHFTVRPPDELHTTQR